MSKSNIFDQPGIEQMLPDADLPVAVKVTGRNMHAVTLLASVSAESLERRVIVSSFFEEDGSLSHVEIFDAEGTFKVESGHYLMLGDDRKTLLSASAEDYEFIKATLPLAAAVAEASTVIANALGGIL